MNLELFRTKPLTLLSRAIASARAFLAGIDGTQYRSSYSSAELWTLRNDQAEYNRFELERMNNGVQFVSTQTPSAWVLAENTAVKIITRSLKAEAQWWEWYSRCTDRWNSNHYLPSNFAASSIKVDGAR
jgi:hypothetical protein